MTGSAALRWLLISSALSTVAFAPGAFAATAGTPAPNSGDAGGILSEVVITATRQVDTVSRVPLSITAVTQKSLDQQGVTQLTDLSRVVPSLSISTTGAGGSVAQIAIRGISSSAGAAVTGVYLDDTSLTKRNANNIAGLNGSPAPPLFDLERVEVLRGPQGTLYGGSSEGGTVRFITPTPSLTHASGYARVQVSQTDFGGVGYEAGVAAGGPIVMDKLGFRASVFHRRTAGYVDAVNPYTQQVFAKDNNWGTQDVLRAVLLWRPTENLSISPSVYASHERSNDSSSYTLPVASAASIAASGFIPQALLNTGWGGLQTRCNALPASPTARTSVTPIVCPAGIGSVTSPGIVTGTDGKSAFAYPAHPAPAYNLSPFQSLRAGPTATTPFTDYNEVASVTADYDLHFADFKVIASYVHDQEKSLTYDTSIITPLFNGYPFTVPEYQNWNANGGNFRPDNKRWGNSIEARLSSPASSKPFNWVIGFFHSNVRATSHYNNIEDVQTPTQIITGLSATQRYGVALRSGEYATRYQNLKDKEDAFFGELNWYVTDTIKLTAGVRRSETSFHYYQAFYGAINGSYDPNAIAGGVTDGTVTQTPISPKFGAQWQFTPNDQVYVTVAKGYRAGGVNSPLSQGQCGPALAALGLTVDQVPKTYDSDSIWSYEAGTKLRLFDNRLAVNAALYKIDWTGLQISVGPNALGCGQQWIQNLGAAESKGGDLEAQFRVFQGFTVSVAANYNQAKYTENAFGPTPLPGSGLTATQFAVAGQTLGLQPYRVNLQAQYNWKLMEKWDSYVRADYTYTPHYTRTVFGQSGYSPDTSEFRSTELVNFRAGITYNALDLNLFVNNVLNSRDQTGQPSGGRTGCVAASGGACTNFTSYTPVQDVITFRPREIGLQGTYKF